MKNKVYYDNLVAKLPQCISWHNGDFQDSIHERPEFICGISDEDKLLAIISAYNKIEMVATYKTICKITGKTKNCVKKELAPFKGLICLIATRDEDNLLNGMGWVFSELYF